MSTQLTYVPVFRSLQEEMKVLRSFNFGQQIFPCLEIVKEVDRVNPVLNLKKPKKDNLKATVVKPDKSFEEAYLPLISAIKAKKIFVDIPVHITPTSDMKPEVLLFLTRVAGNRQVRISYMKKMSAYADKVIPIISTYFLRTGESFTLKMQADDLRATFNSLAFRTFEKSFASDIVQITQLAQSQDYLIVDLGDIPPDPNDDLTIGPILDELKKFDNCPVIILRNAVKSSITNKGLDHCGVVKEIDNRLLLNYKKLYGASFADFVGIKKGDLKKGGGRSPGFIFYDPTENQYYGYRGLSSPADLADIENIIIPEVYNSAAADRMQNSGLPYLGMDNAGWQTLVNILAQLEPGNSQAKLKNISMAHYLHCMRTKINAGHFD
jgi:hypothetical protein